jgi:hypothetical protein
LPEIQAAAWQAFAQQNPSKRVHVLRPFFSGLITPPLFALNSERSSLRRSTIHVDLTALEVRLAWSLAPKLLSHSL